MKLIEPSVTQIVQNPGPLGVFQQIERAGRLCYKSEDKIVDYIKIDMKDVPENADENFWKSMPNYKENSEETIKWLNEKNIKYDFIESASDFVNMLIEKKHYAMLEHGTVYLKQEISHNKNGIDTKYGSNRYSIVVRVWDSDTFTCYITTNYRVIVENGWQEDLLFMCEPTPYHQKRYTFHFVTSIGITREIIRHRHMSFANESTRYCNYSKDKFGNELTFIIPQWIYDCQRYHANTIDSLTRKDKKYLLDFSGEPLIRKLVCEDRVVSSWFNVLKHIEEDYNYYTNDPDGYTLKPQEAREVLPMCTKSEIIVTGFESDWIDFLRLRCAKDAHPDMQYLANKVKEFFPVHTY